jgi:tetratricopeptide (TPR) repeat protein
MARTRRAMGAYVEALEAYQRAFQLGEARSDRLIYAASLYSDLSEDDRALFDQAEVERWLCSACEIDPQSAAAHGMLGDLVLARGDLDAAQTLMRRAVECDPGHLPSLRRLAKLLRRRGDLVGAGEQAAAAQKLEKDLTKKAEWQLWIDEGEAAKTAPPGG